MEEEGGDDSEMIDAMDGWDSEDDSTTQGTDAAESKAATGPAADSRKIDAQWAGKLLNEQARFINIFNQIIIDSCNQRNLTYQKICKKNTFYFHR